MSELRLEIYRKLFARHIEEDSPLYIENGSRAHASVVISELVKSAEKEILIQCTEFNSDVYDSDMITLLNDAADRVDVVKIAIRKKAADDALVKQLSSSIEVLEGADKLSVDFCVVDGKRFRLELDAKKREATACANDPDLGARLRARFIQDEYQEFARCDA